MAEVYLCADINLGMDNAIMIIIYGHPSLAYKESVNKQVLLLTNLYKFDLTI